MARARGLPRASRVYGSLWGFRTLMTTSSPPSSTAATPSRLRDVKRHSAAAAGEKSRENGDLPSGISSSSTSGT